MIKTKPLYFFFIVLLISCNNQPPDILSDEEVISDTAKPILISKTNYGCYPPVFEAAFLNKTIVKQYGTVYSFYSYNLGKIKIESGKILAADPITMRDTEPFSNLFPIGEFPVNLAMAEFKDDERVAFSRILFSNDTIAKWEPALIKGQLPKALDDTTIYCYGVDAGMGIFIDSVSNKAFDKKDVSEWKNAFISKAGDKGYKGHIYEFDGHNVAAFTTGFGDGCFASYIGYNNKDEICQLLTDFNMIDWWTIKQASE